MRSQTEDFLSMSLLTSMNTHLGSPSKTRQEEKNAADINFMMERFGMFAPQKELQFGNVDYDVDLQMALAAIADAKVAWRAMPDDVKKNYPTWQRLLTALESGEIRLKPEEERPEEPAPPAPVGAST